jgi:hypothetical protein
VFQKQHGINQYIKYKNVKVKRPPVSSPHFFDRCGSRAFRRISGDVLTAYRYF